MSISAILEISWVFLLLLFFCCFLLRICLALEIKISEIKMDSTIFSPS